MNIEATSRNRALVATALRHFNAADRADEAGHYTEELVALRGDLIGGVINTELLGNLKEYVWADRHLAFCSDARSACCKAFNTIAQILKD